MHTHVCVCVHTCLRAHVCTAGHCSNVCECVSVCILRFCNPGSPQPFGGSSLHPLLQHPHWCWHGCHPARGRMSPRGGSSPFLTHVRPQKVLYPHAGSRLAASAFPGLAGWEQEGDAAAAVVQVRPAHTSLYQAKDTGEQRIYSMNKPSLENRGIAHSAFGPADSEEGNMGACYRSSLGSPGHKLLCRSRQQCPAHGPATAAPGSAPVPAGNTGGRRRTRPAAMAQPGPAPVLLLVAAPR